MKAVAGIAEYRQASTARRQSIAADQAEALISELVGQAAAFPGDALEDQLCVRLGSVLSHLDGMHPDEVVDPEVFAPVLLAKAVEAAHGSDDTDPRRRVVSTVARILPRRSGGFQDPLGPPEPVLTGQALWTRDAYGSRFAITAPFSSLDGADRWYLWDVDACGLRALTVYNAYFDTSGAALDAWTAGVGEAATADSTLEPIDDPGLAAELLTPEDGIMRIGGENEQQFAEFHRSRRLAEVLIESFGPVPAPGRPELDVKRAAKQFGTWLRAQGTPPQGLSDLATELADTWSPGAPDQLYGTCSPHRVALVRSMIQDYYTDEFADQLIALLPDWISWLADRNGTPAELADRCRPYALGEPYPGLQDRDGALEPLARVSE
jgi:hypothetical protein